MVTEVWYLFLLIYRSLDIVPPQFRRIELSGVKVSDDYLKEILENTKKRVFRFVQMPVRIYIQPTSHQFEEACVRAYENWQNSFEWIGYFCSPYTA